MDQNAKLNRAPQRYQNFATLRSYIFPHFRQITFTCLIYVKEFLKIPRNDLCHGVLLYSSNLPEEANPVKRSVFSF